MDTPEKAPIEKLKDSSDGSKKKPSTNSRLLCGIFEAITIFCEILTVWSILGYFSWLQDHSMYGGFSIFFIGIFAFATAINASFVYMVANKYKEYERYSKLAYIAKVVASVNAAFIAASIVMMAIHMMK